MERANETEISGSVHDALTKLDSERPDQTIKRDLGAKLTFNNFGSFAIVPQTPEQISANLSKQFEWGREGAPSEEIQELRNQAVAQFTPIIAGTRNAIIAEFGQIDTKNEETRGRLADLHKQLDEKFVPQLEWIDARFKAAVLAYKIGDTQKLEEINRMPITFTDLQQLSLRHFEKAVMEMSRERNISKLNTLIYLDVKALHLIHTKRIEDILKDPNSQADQKILKKFSLDFLGVDFKSGHFQQAMAETRNSTLLFKERMAVYGQLHSLARLANNILGEEGNAFCVEEAIADEMIKDEDIAKNVKATQAKLHADVTVGEEDGGKRLELPEMLRMAVDHTKMEVIVKQDTADPKLNLLGKIISRNGETKNPQELKEAWQVIKDWQESSKGDRFSDKRLLKFERQWQKRGTISERQVRELEDTGMLHQLAGYELAFHAETLIENNNSHVQTITDELDNIEGHGHATTAQLDDDFRYENIGQTAGRVISPSGLMSGFLLYTGIMTTALNLAYSIQNDDYDNPYILLGLGEIYLGKEGLSRDYFNTLANPERRVFNELSAIIYTPKNKIITEIFTDPREQAFLQHVDLSATGKRSFQSAMRQEKAQEQRFRKSEQRGDSESPNPYEYKPSKWGKVPEFEISPLELNPESHNLDEDEGKFDFSSIIHSDDKSAVEALKNLRSNNQRDYWRYLAIKWLYDRGIKHEDLDQLFLHSKKAKEALFNPPVPK